MQLRKNSADDVSVHVGKPAIETVLAVCQPLAVDTQQVQNGGMKVVAVRFAFRSFGGPNRRSVRNWFPP